jgi:FKBP-type peptidyl-prolyl cis-trans isomerase
MTRPPSPVELTSLAALALAALLLPACGRHDGTGSTRTLASGLTIVETEVGGGAVAEEGRWVEVSYVARATTSAAHAGANSGATGAAAPPPFDATPAGAPFVFRVGRSKVLAAFAEGVTGMHEGGRRELELPPRLAYGALGKGRVPPDATLHYDIELLQVFARTKLGINYVERRHGNGRKPAIGQRVVIRCREWLVETGRSILDAKRARDGFVVEVGAGEAIPAIDAVLPEMNVGSLWRLGVPPELGYGVTGHLPILVAGQDLVLDLELVSIQDKH